MWVAFSAVDPDADSSHTTAHTNWSLKQNGSSISSDAPVTQSLLGHCAVVCISLSISYISCLLPRAISSSKCLKGPVMWIFICLPPRHSYQWQGSCIMLKRSLYSSIYVSTKHAPHDQVNTTFAVGDQRMDFNVDLCYYNLLSGCLQLTSPWWWEKHIPTPKEVMVYSSLRKSEYKKHVVSTKNINIYILII